VTHRGPTVADSLVTCASAQYDAWAQCLKRFARRWQMVASRLPDALLLAVRLEQASPRACHQRTPYTIQYESRGGTRGSSNGPRHLPRCCDTCPIACPASESSAKRNQPNDFALHALLDVDGSHLGRPRKHGERRGDTPISCACCAATPCGGTWHVSTYISM
jgi:hypothetical protein